MQFFSNFFGKLIIFKIQSAELKVSGVVKMVTKLEESSKGSSKYKVLYFHLIQYTRDSWGFLVPPS